ncbi:MAG: hypothetical protein H7306_13120, partial [Bacteriovorax sp.]|nr:hypothetical protein [Rhizobacter sp.]
MCEPVAVVGWSVVAAPAYLTEAGTPLESADLARHSCLCYWRELSDDLWVLAHAGRTSRVRVQGRYHVDNPEAVAEAAIAGLGIAMLPDDLCQEGLADRRLLRVMPGWVRQTKFGSVISAVSTAERMHLSRNQVLLSFLRSSSPPPEQFLLRRRSASSRPVRSPSPSHHRQRPPHTGRRRLMRDDGEFFGRHRAA